MVEKYYPLDFNQQEMIGLERQLNHFIIDVSTNEDMKKYFYLGGPMSRLC